jgi:hypothetical protein
MDYKRAFCPGRVSKFREKHTGLAEFQITEPRPCDGVWIAANSDIMPLRGNSLAHFEKQTHTASLFLSRGGTVRH